MSMNLFGKIEKLDISIGNSFYSKERDMFYEDVLQSDKSYHGTNNPMAIKVELYSPLLSVENHKFYKGLGIRLEKSVESDSSFANLNYMTPVYFAMMYQKEFGKYNLYGKFNIGYDFAIGKEEYLEKFNGYKNAEINGGMYFGMECGIEYKSLIVGINYNQSSTKLDIPSGTGQVEGKVDRDFSTIALNIGYRLEMSKLREAF